MKNSITVNNYKSRMKRFLTCALTAALSLIFCGVLCFADAQGSITIIVDNLLTNYLRPAFIAVGAVVAIWGFIQIVMAMRREDSEGISKNIITIVVGAAVIAVGWAAPDLYRTISSQH